MDVKKYTDKYFTRTKQVLEAEGLNPFVRAQVFVRNGPGKIAGLNEAVDLIKNNSNLEQNGGAIYSLKDGDVYNAKETQMVIEGRIQDFVELETLYLGVLSAGLTKVNDGTELDFKQITKKMSDVVNAANGRPVSYFGARHYHYNDDAKIAMAAFEGGAQSASTDIAAEQIGQFGIGTIPHALENIFAYKFGKDNAVVEATKAFDRVIDETVPRVALIDYNNREITDSINTKIAVPKLAAIRVDTCGENVAQGALKQYSQTQLANFFERELNIPQEEQKYWAGNGVNISGVYALRKALDNAGQNDVGIFLTSGFGNAKKVEAFARAEDLLETKLFDGLGVGQVYPSRTSTMDIVAVGEDRNNMTPTSKVGREYNSNNRLELVLGNR